MEPVAVGEVPLPQPPAKSRKGLMAAVFVVAAAALALAFWRHFQQHHRERDAAHALDALGVIVVMDAAQSHAGSVNLSTLNDPAKLAAAIEHLPALAYVTALDASRTAISDEQLEKIAQMSRLESLALNTTGVTDAGVARLGGLSNLQALYLAETGVTDAGLADIAKLSQLHILDLSATKVTSDLEPIAGLTQLDWLLLRENQLADDALPNLAKCGTLKRLSLENATYSPDSLTALRKSLTETTIDTQSTSPPAETEASQEMPAPSP